MCWLVDTRKVREIYIHTYIYRENEVKRQERRLPGFWWHFMDRGALDTCLSHFRPLLSLSLSMHIHNTCVCMRASSLFFLLLSVPLIKATNFAGIIIYIPN